MLLFPDISHKPPIPLLRHMRKNENINSFQKPEGAIDSTSDPYTKKFVILLILWTILILGVAPLLLA